MHKQQILILTNSVVIMDRITSVVLLMRWDGSEGEKFSHCVQKKPCRKLNIQIHQDLSCQNQSIQHKESPRSVNTFKEWKHYWEPETCIQ